MKHPIRVALTLLLTMAFAATAPAQETSPSETATAAAETAATAVTATPAPDVMASSSEQLRQELNAILRQHPPEVGTILALDPTLLSDSAFLGRYPEVAAYVAEHPEVRHNPRYYLRDFELNTAPPNTLDKAMEPLMIMAVFSLIAYTLAWFVRSVIEQKRWNRLSRSQSEVHNKILDRFNTSAELLEYIKTPAGSKFLESAPIPVFTEQKPVTNAPLGRAMWSIQLGVVLAAGAIGAILVSLRYPQEGGNELFSMGAIVLCIGLGFIASAAVALVLSRRLAAGGPGQPSPLDHEPVR